MRAAAAPPGGRAWICYKNGNIPYVRHKLAGEEPPLRNLAPRRVAVARGVPGRKTAWGAKSPWSGGGCRGKAEPRPPQPDSPTSSSCFPETPMEPVPGFPRLPRAAGIVVMEVGMLARRGGGHPSLEGRSPPPSPRGTVSPVQSCYPVGQALATASRAKGGLEAGQGVQEPGASEEIHKPSTQDLGLSTPATVGLARGALGPPSVAQPWGGVTPLPARVLHVEPPPPQAQPLAQQF